MAALIGRFSFPGLDPSTVTAAQYSLSHGITPGVVTVEIPAGIAWPQQEGTVRFEFGSIVRTLRNCRVDAGQARLAGGQFWTFPILDKRWRWAFGSIIGHYNVRRPNGSIRPDTEKEARELARLCLQEMKEFDYDVNDIPQGLKPEVHWSWMNPAQALAALADSIGCRVVMEWTGRIAIRRAGVGRNLPDGPSLNLDISYDTGEIPSAVKVVTGQNLYQGRWELEPVGKDTDGKFKPVNELSYKPAGGWENERPGILSGVREIDRDSRTDPRKLALDSVFRCYRIKRLIGTGILPGGPTRAIESYQQCLPLLDGLAEQFDAADDERTRRKPAIVRGKFRADSLSGENVENRTYKKQFSIDTELGIIQFEEPIYLDPTRDGQFRFAEINVEIGFHFAEKFGEPIRKTYRYPVRERPDVGDFIMRRDEIQPVYILGYSASGASQRWSNNEARDELQQQARYQAQIYVTSLNTVESGTRIYAGFMDIEPDGAISQVSLKVGGGTLATMQASRNGEHDTDIYPPYRARRRNEQAKAKESGGNDPGTSKTSGIIAKAI